MSWVWGRGGAGKLPTSLEVLTGNADGQCTVWRPWAGPGRAQAGVLNRRVRAPPSPAPQIPWAGPQNWFASSRPGRGRGDRPGVQRGWECRGAGAGAPPPLASAPPPQAPPRPLAADSQPEEASGTQALVPEPATLGCVVCKQHCCQSSRVREFRESQGGFLCKGESFCQELTHPSFIS